MGDPISFLVYVIIVALLLAILWLVLGLFAMPERIRLAILLLVALLCVLWIAQRAGLVGL